MRLFKKTNSSSNPVVPAIFSNEPFSDILEGFSHLRDNISLEKIVLERNC